MRAIDTLRSHPRVKWVDDERSIGNGVIVTLKAGWHFDPLDYENRVQGEDTPSQALAAVRKAHAVPAGTVLLPDGDEDAAAGPRPAA